MHDIIKAQGESEIDLQLGELCYQVCAERDGVVISIDNFQMSKVARLAGAPMDKKAGVDLLKKLGDEVKKGEALYKIYAEFPADFNFSTSLAQQNSGYVIGEKEQILKPLVDF